SASSSARCEPISPPPITRCLLTRVNLDGIRHLVCTAMAAPRILHVVPHPGGGGETYIRELEALDGFRFDQLALTENRHPYEPPRGLARLRRAIPEHDLLHVHGDSASLVSLPVLGRLPAVITLNGIHLARRMRGARGWAVRRELRRALERVTAV